MTVALTEKNTYTTSLNLSDPRILALFAKASYRKLDNNDTVTGNNAISKMQSSLDSWLPGNKNASNAWKVFKVDGGVDGFQGFAAGRNLDNDGKYKEVIFAFSP